MENVFVSDRGGVAVRPGTELFGVADTVNGPISSIHTSVKRDGTNVMLRASDTVLEYFNRSTGTWALLKNGFTTNQVFGFADHNLNSDATDYVYFCNAVESYQRWTLAFDMTTAPLVGGELEIPVTSTLVDSVFFTGTASAVAVTTVTVATPTWVPNEWNSGFYIRITDGASIGSVSPISATTTTQITFTAIAGLVGTPTFEIRRLKFDPSGSAIINGSIVAYTQIVRDNRLPVVAAPAAASGSPIAQTPIELLSNACPRGNILKVMFQTMFVAGVKAHPTTIYRSRLSNAANFTFGSPRVAGEGDVIDVPDGGGGVNDLDVFEDQLLVFKESYIEQIVFTQDANDLPNRKPIVKSPLIGTQGRVFRMGDQIVFANPSNEITTLQRAINRDVRPQTANLAFPIKRAIRHFDFDLNRGITFQNYTLIAAKKTSDSITNDLIILFDNNLQRWVGEWSLPAAAFTVYDNELYFGSSASREVYKMFTTLNSTVKGDVSLGYDTLVETQWGNKTEGGLQTQRFNTIGITGYIKLNTKLALSLFYDFEVEATHNWIFDPLNSVPMVLEGVGELTLGTAPIGVTPLGVELGEEEGDFGERRFLVYYRVPFRDHVWMKMQMSSTGENQYFEVTDILANFQQDESDPLQIYIKSLEDS